MPAKSAFTVEEEIDIQNRFQDLLHKCTFVTEEADRIMIRKAFDVANAAHYGMRRKSGEPYMVHPIAVAEIVAFEVGLGTTSITSALLHDVVEDTDYTIEMIRRNFNDKVAYIVDGLTKISDLFDKNTSLQAENFKKMLLTISDDVRVILIKIADRLHNMRTLESLTPAQQIKIASETIYLYAPLAHRLGLYAIKQELEDLSLKYRHPKIYNELVAKIADTEAERCELINRFIDPIRRELEAHHYDFTISGRPKSVYSVYYKMQHKGIPFEEIYDLLAVRIVFQPSDATPEKNQCWDIYSLITNIYTPKYERIRDWVTTPKSNGYEALHVTVMGPGGKWVEVQIRTRRMDEVAEKGFAAHWRYKSLNGLPNEAELDRWLNRIREMLGENNGNAIEFVDDFKVNLLSSEIQVFTPKGQIKILPQKATALDFAYEIHSEVGNTALAAKINHKLMPLNTELHSGDQVEIITSGQKQYQREWLQQVVTPKARNQIKQALSADVGDRIELGRQMLTDRLTALRLKPSSRIIKKLIPAYHVSNKEELYGNIGSGEVSLENLQQVLQKSAPNKFIRYWKLQTVSGQPEADTTVNGAATDRPAPVFRTARCCNPIPGDDVIGYRTPDNEIVIHKTRCPSATHLAANYGNRIVPVRWVSTKILSSLIRLSLRGIDRIGIYHQITGVISEGFNINIRNVHLISHDGIFEGHIDMYIHAASDLESLIESLKTLKGVEEVKRVDIRNGEADADTSMPPSV
ncbi:MAG: bifunctional (p)ppGpp synthetase/guanosine-3',5'-bis(diphosphate) 3'-pyrophosphohydrolase [Bacteroidales bacterium]|nr:bifunctional (p)ppGpp synthetase/guanosine-3',5'-bis(diphosphate) 3'-pyrophosphohydrolase [Bacteroidales bacterium]